MLGKLIDRPIAVTMITLVIVVLGIVSIRNLPVSLIPDVDIPFITVQVSSPDMSARELDESVVDPLRRQFIQIAGIGDLSSSVKDGSAVMRLSFAYGADIDYLFIEVNEKIDRMMGTLPDIDRPKVMKASASDIPAFYIDITLPDGGNSPEEFSRMSSFVQEVICRRIEQVDEVAMVDVSGLVDEEIVVTPDAGKLASLGLTQQSFERLINSANIRLGSLSVRDGQYRYNVKFRSTISSQEDVGNIWFRNGDRVFQLKDIASVDRRQAMRVGEVRSNGYDAVCLAVIKQSDARMSSLKKSVGDLLEQFSKDYPQLSFKVTRDQTQLLDYSIRNLVQNIIWGLIFACVIIFLFMKDFRSPAQVSLSIPVALVFSMAVFHAVGLTANIISLAGLLLGVGMMTDNTVVLIDNITARWQRGESLKDSVVQGTKEVTGPMLSSVLTTCAVFIPLVFMNGMVGALFYDQAMAVTIVLLTSYIVTITVIPVYYYLWYRRSKEFKPSRILEKLSPHGLLTKFEEKCVAWLLDHSFVSWSILALSVVGIALCVMWIPKSKLPEMASSETILNIDWNEQVSVDENASRVGVLESLADDYAVQITSMIGSQQFLLSHSGDLSPSEVAVYLKCENQETLDKMKSFLEKELQSRWKDADYFFKPSENIFDVVFGQNEPELVAHLKPASGELEIDKLDRTLDELRRSIPGVRIPAVPVKTDMLFVADPELMALYGVSYSELASVLRRAASRNHIFDIVQGHNVLPVITGSDMAGSRSNSLTESLETAYVVSNGVSVPVSKLMRQTFVEDFKVLLSDREGIYYPIEMDVPSKDVPEMMAAVRKAVAVNDDFDVSFSGSWFSSRGMLDEMMLIFAVAIILLYLILASQFESLVQPLIVMSEILVDVFASLAVLWALGVSLNIMSLIGIVVVCGIVINDSILKVDTVNRLRKDGLPLRSAVLEAGRRRMKAIIMTSLTTILAVAPFLSRGSMGDDLQYPMSVVIIAGLTVGTLVSLIVLPSLYYSIYRRRSTQSAASSSDQSINSCTGIDDTDNTDAPDISNCIVSQGDNDCGGVGGQSIDEQIDNETVE